jgi:hypothetical protein
VHRIELLLRPFVQAHVCACIGMYAPTRQNPPGFKLYRPTSKIPRTNVLFSPCHVSKNTPGFNH